MGGTAVSADDGRRSPLGRCVGFEDGMDGFVVHAEDCPAAGRGWLQSSNCIEYGTWQEGAWPEWAYAPQSVADDPTVGWPNSPVWWSADAGGQS